MALDGVPFTEINERIVVSAEKDQIAPMATAG